MINKSRLDLYLLNKGLCETRQKAQGLILAGKVKDINGKICDKPGQQVSIGTEFFIESEPQFVSRGGEKLLEAFKKLNTAYKSDKKNPDILNYMGFTSRKTGNFKEAENYYLKGLNLDPKHNGINEYLGELYVQTNRIDKANERLAVLKNCDCEEYQDLELIIKTRGTKIY